MRNSLTRREMLRLSVAGAFAGTAVSWLDIVAGRGLAQAAITGRKHKSCIVLFMSGGPSHSHTFDVKPKSPYRTIATSAPDIEISEYLPKVAQQMKHMSLVRGMSTTDANHQSAHFLMRTGFRQGFGGIDYPHFGAVAAKEIVREDTRMPNFIVLKPGSGSRNGHSAGFVGAKYAPMTMKDVGVGIQNLLPPDDMSAFDRRAALLAKQDQRFAEEYKLAAAQAKMESYQKAIDLVHFGKAKDAFEIDREPEGIKKQYGEGAFARQCLGARRLIEAGVPFVEVMHPRYWDTHGGAERGQKSLSEEMDQPMAALLADLADRGLLETTLVVWMGEFGRDFSGNNHYAKAWTTGFAGAGVVGGRVVGKTDEKAMTVVDRPVKVGDFVATIYKALDIDHTLEVDVNGRPVKLTDDGEPVHELFG
ncbi:MAG: DUF1501 domain-containing protein [Planctomycetaceae bacterium]|nr:DUF1501 domain-containing protein [Planctomycetaceae bacterium]